MSAGWPQFSREIGPGTDITFLRSYKRMFWGRLTPGRNPFAPASSPRFLGIQSVIPSLART